MGRGCALQPPDPSFTRLGRDVSQGWQSLLGLGPVLLLHPFTHKFMHFLTHSLLFFFFLIFTYYLFMYRLLWVLVMAHGIFSCSIQTLSCGCGT